MGVFQNNLMGAAAAAASAGGAGFYDHQISNSLRMVAPSSTAADNARLTRTVGTVDSNVHWTLNFWIKRSAIEGNNPVGASRLLNVFTPRSGTSGSVLQEFGFAATGSYAGGDAFVITNTNTGTYILSTNNLFRDTSAWYNIHIQADLDNGTAGEKLKIFINGTEASYNVDNRSSYTSLAGMVAGAWTIGDYYNYGYPIQSYLAQWCYIDGTTVAASEFGETKNGVWIPKDPSGLSFGSEGFLLNFESSSDLGNDSSGNNNDWTSANLATHDQMTDSPTFGSEGSANFPTLNPLDPTIPLAAVSNGNLQITEVANNRGAKANFAIPLTGKWYWEHYVYADSAQELWGGITGITADSSGDGRGGSSNSNTYAGSWSNYSGSNMYIRKFVAGTESAVSGSFGTTKDTILGIAVNRDDNEIKCYKNNALQFTESISATQEYFPAGGLGGGTNATTINIFNFGQDGTFGGNETAGGNADSNGYGDFFYAPPTGHLALCSGNLPTGDEVDPAQTDDDYPQELFFMSQYSGNLTGRTVTTENQPDLMFIRHYSTGQNWYTLDSTRVITDNKYILANTNAAEATLPQANITSVGATSVGISSGTWLNSTGSNYQMWMWRCNGGSTSSGSGDLTSTHQVDPSGGFSIVKAVGDGGSGDKTVSHGLSAAPTVILAKNLDASYNWDTYFAEGVTAGSGMRLNTTDAPLTGRWGTINSSIMTYKDNYTWYSTNNYIYYCFTNIEGYIKAGSYTGNASTDNAFVWTGFRPAFVLTKGVNSGDGWNVHDNKLSPYNVADTVLQLNAASAELSNYNIDMLSNGFKVRDADGDLGAARTYVYLAFAHNPFQYATAR